MRGKDRVKRQIHRCTRITPAYAGKRIFEVFRYEHRGDHPRLCGEKVPRPRNGKEQAGSPPPMRGKGLVGRDPCVNHRITPAYAGKSVSYEKLPSVNKDHPRLCGEKPCWQCPLQRSWGSPPPMRGKAHFCPSSFSSSRITPAYAGKRALRFQAAIASGDHPRLCGEKTKKIPKQRYFFHQPASFSFSLQYT